MMGEDDVVVAVVDNFVVVVVVVVVIDISSLSSSFPTPASTSFPTSLPTTLVCPDCALFISGAKSRIMVGSGNDKCVVMNSWT